MVVRDPDATREALLQAGFDEVYRSGFRSARLERILERTSVTKGAFYHHFPTKRALGEAIIDEVVRARIGGLFIEPLRDTTDPVPVLAGILENFAGGLPDDFIECGCPLGNLAQELSPVDDDFRVRIQAVFASWIDAVAAALERGQRAGTVSARIDPRKTSLFIVASLEGGMGMAKQSRDRNTLGTFTEALIAYLETLKP